MAVSEALRLLPVSWKLAVVGQSNPALCLSFSSSCPKHSQESFPPVTDLHDSTACPQIIWDYFLKSLTPATSSHLPCDWTFTVLGLRTTEFFCLQSHSFFHPGTLQFDGMQSFAAEAFRDNYNRYKGIALIKRHRLLTWVHRATKSRRGRQHLWPIVYQSSLKVRSRCCLSLHAVRLLAQGASAWKLVRHHRSLPSPVAHLTGRFPLQDWRHKDKISPKRCLENLCSST